MSPLKHICHNLNTQDNRITAEPIFAVQQLKRIYGMDPQWDDAGDFEWTYEDECVPVMDEEAKLLEAQFKQDRDYEPDGYRRLSYIDIWEFVQPFFTEDQADAYIKANAHNLKEPRTYVYSGHRNPEWQAIREHFMDWPSPHLRAFTRAMQLKLRENKKALWWRKEDVFLLSSYLSTEVSRLNFALQEGVDPSGIGRQAAEVANLAMMIADVQGALKNPS